MKILTRTFCITCLSHREYVHHINIVYIYQTIIYRLSTSFHQIYFSKSHSYYLQFETPAFTATLMSNRVGKPRQPRSFFINFDQKEYASHDGNEKRTLIILSFFCSYFYIRYFFIKKIKLFK